MTKRAERLHATADEQIAELIELASTLDEATARLPCPGREKLGDGTIAASVRHTADNYERIGVFINASDEMSGAHGRRGAHSAPSAVRGLGHGPTRNPEHGPEANQHDRQYTADNLDLSALIQQLSASRSAMRRLAGLADTQLDAIPPDGSFRFCDGQRTLAQVLTSLLKHQRHQVDTVRAAVA
jgi:hypothetical protein